MTLADWVCAAARKAMPIIEAIHAHSSRPSGFHINHHQRAGAAEVNDAPRSTMHIHA
jgi:hypothetical protein